MNQTSNEDAIEAVRARTDIVELVGRYLKLKKAGSRYLGLCPFHAEKTPSFSVNPQKGLFHCFGCKESGDVFSFLMRLEGKTFPEALEDLARRAGVPLPERRAVDSKVREEKQRLLDALDQAQAFFVERLWSSAGTAAREYLKRRGLTEEQVRRFKLGFAPPGWHALEEQLERAKCAQEDAQKAGLLARGAKGTYDLFRNRLTFPIIGLDDRIHGFGGRALDPAEQAKYINSPQSPVFDKSHILYGLAWARPAIQRKGRAVLVEGYFDALTLAGQGLEEVVATCGTSLTEGHASLLKRFTSRVVCVFDGDAAGQKGTRRAAEVLLPSDLGAYALALPPGEDPDTFVLSRGIAVFEELLDGAQHVLDPISEQLAREAGADVEKRSRAGRELAPLLSAVNDRILRSKYVALVADRMQISEVELGRAVEEQRRGKGRPALPERRLAVPDQVDDEVRVLSLLLLHPHLCQTLDVAFEQPAAARLLMRLQAEGGASPSALLREIEDDSLRARITGEMMKRGDLSADAAEADLDFFMRSLKASELRRQRFRLREEIAVAQREGREEDYRHLREAQLEVVRRIKALGLAVKG